MAKPMRDAVSVTRLDAVSGLLVAEERWSGSVAGPAAITVHDDGQHAAACGRAELLVDGALLTRQLMQAGRVQSIHQDLPRQLLLILRDGRLGDAGWAQPAAGAGAVTPDRSWSAR